MWCKSRQSIESILNLTKETTDALRQIVMATQQQKRHGAVVDMKEIFDDGRGLNNLLPLSPN